jgi:hypothetical protein
MPYVGVVAPRAQLGLRSSAETRWRLGFHMVACRCVLIEALAPPLIFIEHVNKLHYSRSISILI